MKNFLLLYLISSGLIMTSHRVMADERERTSFCDECGTLVRVDLISIYKPNGEFDRLLCKKCLKRMKGRKDGTASSPVFFSPFSLGFDSVFDSPLCTPSPSSSVEAPISPITPLSPEVSLPRSASVPATFFIDERKAAELAEFIVEQRLKRGTDLGKDFLESYGQPTTFNEALSLKIRIFEKLYEASKMPEDEKYKYTLHEVKKSADVIDPQGNEHFYTVDGTLPFLWKRGGFFVFKRAHSLEVKDLANDRFYSFPEDTLSLAVLKEKCQDYGFEKITPLSPYQEADLAYQAAIDRLPSPKFSS